MAVQRIVVCEAQVPFVRGGAQYLVRSLVGELQQRGYEAELVSMPFKWYPKDELLAHAAAWGLVDLSESNGRSIDLVIATKFPTYFIRHTNKVTWLMHQYRSAYDLCGTVYSEFTHAEGDVGLRETLIGLDAETLNESRRLFSISRNTSARLQTFNGIACEALYPPSPFTGRLGPGPFGDYVLFAGRLESVKRPDLVVQAMCHVDRPVRLVMVGDGTRRAETEALAESLGVADRIDFRGATDEESLLALYNGALAIVYPPYDEDYGYVTLEAFLSHKPVITVVDAGGPLEFVEDGVNGCICAPEPEAVAGAINQLAGDRAKAARLGLAGFDRVRDITWDHVISKLVE